MTIPLSAMQWAEIRDVLDLIEAEREAQIVKHGYTADHDDKHVNGELAQGAVAYVLKSLGSEPEAHWPLGSEPEAHWPFTEPMRSGTRIEHLIRAGAMIVAEIERLRR